MVRAAASRARENYSLKIAVRWMKIGAARRQNMEGTTKAPRHCQPSAVDERRISLPLTHSRTFSGNGR
jgi:hypothetical protein